MKRTVEVTYTTTEKRTEEVEFPVYRHHDVGGDGYEADIYTRIDADKDGFTEVSITVSHSWQNDEGTKYQIEGPHKCFFDARSSADYNYGRGEYKCSEDEFIKVLNNCSAALDVIKVMFGTRLGT
jgi:hypothetical protein